MKLDRRGLLMSLLGLSAFRGLLAEDGGRVPSLAEALAALERVHGGRLGVSVLDTASGTSTGHRENERFGMCSTFKVLLAALILQEIAAGRLSGERVVPISEQDLVPYSPVTSTKVEAGGMTVLELAETAQTTSDNTAANLLLGFLGGPAGFTKRLRVVGDDQTRLDRLEPVMNLVPAGEVRDTTTPAAMAATVAHFVLGAGLGEADRERLLAWMRQTRTGRRRLRAGLPEAWRSGDKTGTGIAADMANKYNDVAVTFPPGRAPLVVAAYYEAPGYFENMRGEDEAVLAAVGSRVAERFGDPSRR
jgi:beta-lactamase class A